MLASIAIKRPICTNCLRPQASCICRWITPTDNAIKVLLLQHPLEVHAAKGTARLLQLSLRGSRMVSGERIDPLHLMSLLTEPFDAADADQRVRRSILQYPETPQDHALGLAAPPPLTPELLAEPDRLRLVVLDGTWRKSRKMLYLNPLLQQLPRLSLQGLPASNYLIRKAHQPDQWSTLEATCAALARLEGDAEKFQPLLRAFDGFIAQQLAYQAN